MYAVPFPIAVVLFPIAAVITGTVMSLVPALIKMCFASFGVVGLMQGSGFQSLRELAFKGS